MLKHARSGDRSDSSSSAEGPNPSIDTGVHSNVARMPRIALISLTAVVAACLFSVFMLAGTANANITTSLDARYQQNGTTTEIANPVAGSHPDYRQIINIGGSDDLQRLILDFPTGLLGDPNAIAAASRCTVDYTGVTATSGSPSYAGCPASSRVGTIRAVAESGLTCSDITLNGSIYLLQNRPSADPEVPAYLGINLSGTANVWLLFCAGLTANMNMTARITVRPSDQGLRIQIIDDLPKTDPIIGGDIRIKTIDETISGLIGTKPFVTVPTRCGASSTWDTNAFTRAYASNTNTNASIDGVAYLAAPSSRTGTCTGAAAPGHTFSLSQTNTNPGAPVGLRAVLNNPVPTTNVNQAAYAKTFSLVLPVGFKVNPAIGARLVGPGGGCTEAQFLQPDANNPVTNNAPTCPTTSQVGNVAVAVPEITGDLTGRIYLGEPRAGDVAAGIYRLYIHAVRGGVVTKFQGTATANPVNGQVTVTVDNTNSYFNGLPQFNYSKFDMDFNSNSSGIGSPSSGAVVNPSDAQQMLVNPQWCGSHSASVTVVPWTSPTQANETFSPTLTTSGTPLQCAFGNFAPTFTAKLTNAGSGSGGAINYKAGQHPDLTLSISRPDRTDNIKNMVFKLPVGFAGSATAAPTCSGITNTSLGTCGSGNVVGTVAVQVGNGTQTVSMPSTIYNVVTDNSSQTAKLAIVTPASVGPFNLGNVINYSILTVDSATNFRLTASTDLTQSINGIPVSYRSLDLTLNGMIGSTPFLTSPSATCGSPLSFDYSFTSNGDPNGSSSASVPGSVSSGVYSTTPNNLDCGTAVQPFSPTLSVTPTTTVAAQPTGLTLTVNQSQTAATTQQSTIKTVGITMPAGLEINPGFASSVTACPTATINGNFTSKTDGCSGIATKIADVTVSTPLLPNGSITGKVYMETPNSSTLASRYQLVMYLSMPGGMIIVRGNATLNGSSAGGVSGSTGAVNSGTGQLVANFPSTATSVVGAQGSATNPYLPDVPYSQMALAFNSTTPMYVNSDTVGSQGFAASFTPWSTSSTTPATSSPSYTTTTNGGGGWAPTFSQTISSTVANAHPDLTLTVNRPEVNQQLASVDFRLPSGLTGAPAAVPTCTQTLADAGNCPANSRVGTVTASVGSALIATPSVGLATLNGNIYNTVAPSTAPAKLTAVVPVVLGPFNLGSMTLPVNVSMRNASDPDPYGLNATVTLPNRYEGVKVRYRTLTVVINGVAPGNGANFLTNPSSCSALKTTTAVMTSDLANVVNGTQSFTPTSCSSGFGTTPTATVATNPAAPANQAAVGLNVNVASAATNPTMKQLKLTFPTGMSINPAVGNYASGFTCPTATINASTGSTDACSVAGKQVIGTVAMQTPLISGTFNGNLYLETPDSSGNPANRFRVAMIIPIPGQMLVIRGVARVNGETTVTAGGTGAVDSGTGVVTVDFDNIPDLSFSSLAVAMSTGSKALFVTPTTCSATNTIVAQMYPYTSPGTATTQNSNFNTNTNCQAISFAPTFSASAASTTAAANSNLTMTATNAGAAVDPLRSVTYHLPTGWVANTNNVARCTQAAAAAATCATPVVGTASASVGTNAETYALSGSIYNVTPNATEPARLQVIIPVNVGPYALGNLSVPVTTSLRADYGIDASATLPTKYEGIDIRTRSLSVTLSGTVGGQRFMQNPSVCSAKSISADMGNGTTTVTGSQSITITGCPLGFSPDPTLTVTPSTTQAADPVGLTFAIGNSASNPTIKRVQLQFPNGMEINPAFGNSLSGANATCTAATVAGCAGATSIATVSLTTPLLSTSPISGNVYVVSPGTTAATRYRVVMIVDLPGSNELVVPGAVTVNGSTDITGGTGSTSTSATGQISADFNNIPDLGFTALSMAFNSGTQAMVVNPDANGSASFSGTFTPNSTSTSAQDKVVTTAYTTTGAGTSFDPSFTATASTYVSAAHPTLTMNVGRNDKQKQLKDVTIHFPAGLTANTANIATANQCTQASANAGTCSTTAATSQVGTFTTSIGSGTETYSLTGGQIFEVVPNANEPARFQAIIPVVVGPFNLGKMTVPVTASLRSGDYGIDLATSLPTRYEGIAVRLRTLQMVINGTVNGLPYMNNPSKCSAGTISADMQAADGTNDSSSSNNSSAYTATGCGVAFGTTPTATITGVSTTTQTPTGMNVSIGSASTNPTIGGVSIALPAGMSLNPAVGNNGSSTTCSTALINAGGSGCPALSQQGTVSMQSALIGGTFTGKVFLEDPGTTAATRYRLAIIIDLPGTTDLVVRGTADVAGDTDVTAGGAGATGTSSGAITVSFPSIPDLGFTNLSLSMTTGSRSVLVTPSTCQVNNFGIQISPNGGASTVTTTPTQSFTTGTDCTQSFSPTLSAATLSDSTAGAHPDMSLTVTNGGSTVNGLKNVNLKLPTGLVANTTVVSRCTQASANAGTCGTTAPLSAVGTVSTSIGTSAETLSLPGTIYNVDPDTTEPARLQVVIPVNVGPYVLGNLSVKVNTALNDGVADSTRKYAIDTFSTLPTSYEGIDVRVRALTLNLSGVISGQNFMINPSTCGTKPVTADLISTDNVTVSSSRNFTFTGCNRNYGTAPTLNVTPSTLQAGQPTGLTFDLGTNINNPTTSGIVVNFPLGMELNPAAGNGLTACSTANIDAGGGSCAVSSQLGTVTLNTPLLPLAQTGEIYLETPGTTAATRYKTAIVVHLPGANLVLHGSIDLNGSTTIPTGGLGSTSESSTGRITATFNGIPDLGFTNMNVAFNSGNRALFVNPTTCAATAFSAVFTPTGTGSTATANSSYTTNTNCSSGTTFVPTFSATVSTTASNGNPDLTLNFTRPDNNRDIRSISVALPTGLVAQTSATTLCSQATAAAGNCLTSQEVGDVTTTIGSGAETYSLSGKLHNVTPNAGEPARFGVTIPVLVGPFDLGKLTIPVATTLRSDYGVTADASLPARYEGIAVHVRTLQLKLLGTLPNAGNARFVTNPSKCQSNTINATVTSTGASPATANGSSNFTTTACGNFGSTPTLNVARSTDQAADPVGLTFNVASAATNPTIGRVQVQFPLGMEVNPAFANGLTPCSTANITAGTCNSADAIGTVTLNTPLLSTNPVTGFVYLETPGTTAATRYRVALIVQLPGQKLIVRGAVTVNGSTDIPTGGTGSTSTSSTGQVSVDFSNIPDLGFTSMQIAFNSGTRAMVVNPETCTTATFAGTFTPNSSSSTASNNSTYTPTNCSTAFNPSLTVTTASKAPAAHPNVTFTVARADKQKSLGNMTLHLPTGLVANTSVIPTANLCTQASANAATCATTAATSQVGTFSTSFGSGTETYSLSGGKLFQVVPNTNEPVRFQAIVPVLVGPFDLGNMTIPVSASLRSDYGIDAAATLPSRYEGIAVRIQSLAMTLNGTVNGQSYMTNPSKCQANNVTADFTAADSTPDSSTANNSSDYTITGCSGTVPPYNPALSASVNPTAAGNPTALTLGITVPADNATTNTVQVQLPQGMELNPGVGNGLVACTTIDTDAGASCKLTTANLATVTLNTPLLPTAQTGEVYLETPGTTASTRYKLAMVIHLPGRDMVIRGGTLVDGSTTIPTGGLGSTDASGTATGRVTATFPGIPDLGFTSMSIAFNSSNKLLVNPKTAATHTVNGTFTPNSSSTTKTANATFTTSGGTTTVTGWNPTFSASLSPSTSASNPNLTLNVGNPLGTQELKSFDIKLPEGLVANTTAVTRCSQANADAANCSAANFVGTASTTFGSSDTVGEDYTVLGSIYNVIPNSNQPARLQAIVPVQVGPFDLGKLSIPVPTSLNSDLTVTASASLPSRYEGIAVRVRAMQMVIQGQPNGNKFMVAPTKCGSSNIAATLRSDTNSTATVTSAINVTGCPTNFGTSPAFQVTPDNTTRTTPVNLTFKLTSSATNPTIGRVQVQMPTGMEINPGFANNLTACSSTSIDAGGDTCPASSQIGTVNLKTQLLDPTVAYTGKVFLETPGNTATTRYKIALVVELPGADLIIHGKVQINGSSTIPTGGTGAVDSGTGVITADFDTIPDLGFTELEMAFSSTNPMLINPQTCSANTFTATVTPSSNGSTASPTSAYTTTPAGCGDAFSPNFSITADGANTATAGSHPDLNIHVDRPNGTNALNQRYLRQLNLDLPVGLVAATTATSYCTQANAAAGNCTSNALVGSFDTFIGNTTSSTSNLEMAGQIYNVTPNASEPARLAAITNVTVGPYDLGKLVIPITTTLNTDLSVSTQTTIPNRYEGIAVRIKTLDIDLFGTAPATGDPFVSMPSKCQSNTVTAKMTSDTGTLSNKTSSITTTGCPQNFSTAPSVAVTANPTTTSLPTALNVTVGSAPANPTISRVQMAMPAGMSINPAVGNNGSNTTCSTALIDAGGSGCPAASKQGDVTLNTRLLNAPQTGAIYLEDPGTTPSTRYKLAIVVHLPGTDLIIRGAVNVNGSSAGGTTGATGSVDTGTGQITADFTAIPDLAFTSMNIAFNSGPRALLVNADSCGTQTFASTVSTHAGGADANVNNTYTTTGTGTGCATQETFNPSFTATAASTVSGANTDLNLGVANNITNDYLREFNLKLPAGLVASTTATTTRCTQVQAAAATCTAASRVGTISTDLGTGSEKLSVPGTIYNVVPNSDEPARLAAIIPVVVGPYNLGNLSLPVTTQLRGDDYGVDTKTTIPYKYEGIAVKIANMSMQLFGTVDQGTVPTGDDAGFIKNPSKCDAVGSSIPIRAELKTLGGSTVTKSVNYPVTGCPKNFVSAPTLTISGTTGTTAVPTGMTLQIDSSDQNPTVGSVNTTMPLGMTLNPAVAKLNGGIAACSTSTIDDIKNGVGGTCPAASKVGDVSLVTPLLPGTQTGSVYLEQPGSSAATRYKLAIIVDLPGTRLVVRGSVAVDGSSDITGGVGSTGTAGTTGRIVASFPSIPDLGFTQLSIAFSGGANALLTNAETPGTQTVDAQITPQSGGSTANVSGTYATTYGGSGSIGSEPFDPTFAATFSKSGAAQNPDMTITLNRNDYTQQLEQFDLNLPPGLVANTVDTARCSQASAAAGTCAAASRVGTVSTKIGTGTDTLDMNGTIYNVIPDADEPARLAAVIPVVVGPYDLGKLSLPVETEIVTGAQASDLSIDTHTTIPKWYEGVPVRIRQLSITINGVSDGGTPGNTSDDHPFMINPSQCGTHTLGATLGSTLGNSLTRTSNFVIDDCANAPYNPAIDAQLSTTERGKPVGLDLSFQFSGNSSSTKKIVTTFPVGMSINPGVGNYGAGMVCDESLVQAGGAGCPTSSRLGDVKLDTPLLPTQQTGALYLLPPVGNQASTRYRLGLFVDLPGSGDLYTEGAVTVDGSSDVPTGGTGSVDSGNGQVVATFDNLPDLQFSNLQLQFKTTGAGEHALLTNPNSCGTFNIVAAMNSWANPTATPTSASTSFTTTSTATCTQTQSATVSAEIGDNNPSGPAYYAGAHEDVSMTVSRPDTDKSIKRIKFLLPAGLVGSADAAPTCPDAVADAGNCDTVANTQIGSTTLKIGDSSDTYEISGGLYNVVAPSNRPAKLSFAADINVGPFALGKVVVPVDVNLDNNDFSLFAETGDMPQVFEGIPVRISSMAIHLNAMGSNGAFMTNPHSCSDTLDVRAVITAPDNTTQSVSAPLAGPFTNCGSLNLDDTNVTVDNAPVPPETGRDAEHPTGINVQVDATGSSTTQATLKKLALDLPGFRLSAPAANGLQACSAADLDAETCPANSKVGTAWIDTPLLPVDQVNPDNSSDPNLHSLWGSVYLETPGTNPDGSDRYKLAIQLTGKTLITIRGVANVNETTGEITTTFDDLPDIPFTKFRVELTGYKNGVGNYFPLLLNPEKAVGDNNPVTATADLTSHNEVDATRTDDLTVDPPASPKAFSPSSDVNLSTQQSGAHPNAVFTIARNDGQQDIKKVSMALPAGFLGSANTVPLCSLASAAAGGCSSTSAVGTVTAKIGQFGQTLSLPGTVYLTDGVNGDIAGMSIKVPAIAGPYNLGDYITQGRIQIRPSDHGINVDFDEVPFMFKGVPTHIQELTINLPGVVNNKPFLYNASSCGNQNIASTMTPWTGSAMTDNTPYTTTGCGTRSFSPSMSFTASGGSFDVPPAWTIKMNSNTGDSTLKSVSVVLPSIMTVNIQGLPSACTADQAAAHNCPASSQIGTVSIDTPLLPTAVTGTVYIARSITGSTLPDLLMEIPAPINMQIRGANKFVNNIYVQSDFTDLPDLVWSGMTMSIAGGAKGLIGLRDNGTCGPANSSFGSHSGQSVTGTSPVNGVGECANIPVICANPDVSVSTKSVKKKVKKGKKNTKMASTIKFSTRNFCGAVKSLTVLYPKGSKINKSLMKYGKGKKYKKYKKNKKNVSGNAGSKSLVASDFKASGKNGIKIKAPLGDSTRTITIKTQKSTMLFPAKTFCVGLKGKKLKKCKKKNVTFTFVVTRTDGTVFRYNYTKPAGDKSFK